MLSPIELNIMKATSDENKSLMTKLNDLIMRIVPAYKYLRADTEKLETKINAGVSSGWFDDGTNFRVTVTNGIITAIGDSSGGGHS
jgi:hypothetical protein